MTHDWSWEVPAAQHIEFIRRVGQRTRLRAYPSLLGLLGNDRLGLRQNDYATIGDCVVGTVVLKVMAQRYPPGHHNVLVEDHPADPSTFTYLHSVKQY